MGYARHRSLDTTVMAPTDRRVCLLTGAAGRLGSCVCRVLVNEYAIAAVYHTVPPVLESHTERIVDPLDLHCPIREVAPVMYTIPADLMCRGEAERVVDLALARFGRIDVLINGAMCYEWGPVASSRFRDGLDRQIKMNALVPTWTTTAVVERFWSAHAEDNLARNRGVVNVSSVSGTRVYPGHGQGGYSAGNAALNMLSRHMACELAAINVRVNCVAPNAFPQIVSTERVVRAIVRLDRGTDTGAVLTIDAEA
jgi:NAD(P)-dependent dehydrogenase (short-subunit alcohol dehydrogenase family)